MLVTINHDDARALYNVELSRVPCMGEKVYIDDVGYIVKEVMHVANYGNQKAVAQIAVISRN